MTKLHQAGKITICIKSVAVQITQLIVSNHSIATIVLRLSTYILLSCDILIRV